MSPAAGLALVRRLVLTCSQSLWATARDLVSLVADALRAHGCSRAVKTATWGALLVLLALAALCTLTRGVWLAGFLLVMDGTLLVAVAALAGRSDTGFLVRLAVIALAARWLVGAVLHAVLVTEGAPFLFNDERGYHMVGVDLSETWLGLGSGVPASDRYLISPFTALLGAVYTLAGFEVLAGRAVTIGFAVLTIPLCHQMASFIWPGRRELARTAALLIALYPTTLGWSVLILKDSSVYFALALTIVAWLHVRERPKVGWSLALVGSLAWFLTIRTEQALVTVTVILVASAALWAGRERRRWLVAAALLSALTIAAVAEPTMRGRISDVPERLAERRTYGALTADTGIPSALDPHADTWGDSLAYLPTGLEAVLFRPYPWEARTAAEVVGVAFTSLAVVAYFLALLGLWERVGTATAPIGISLALVAIGTWLAFALGEGNVGTAFRHRDAVAPIVLTLAAGGVIYLRNRYEWRLRHSLDRGPEDGT